MDQYVYIAISFFILIISVIVHEIMHAYASYSLGDDTARLLGRLSTNPIKHIDPFMTIILPGLLILSNLPVIGGAKPVPVNYNKLKMGDFGRLIVSISGPVSNLVIAFISFGILSLLSTEGLLLDSMYIAFRINIVLFVFNMLPIPPLDGSRILYALAPDFVRDYMDMVEKYGFFVILIIFSLFQDFFGLLMQSSVELFFDIFSLIFII